MILEELKEGFLHYLKLLGFSENTQLAYFADTELFLKWVKSKDPFLVTQEDIASFLKEESASVSSATLQRRTFSIKAFFRFLVHEKGLKKDPSSNIEGPRLWQKLPDVLNLSEIERLLAALESSSEEGSLTTVIFELLYGAGLRASELAALNIEDLEEDMIAVRGKGGKERRVPLGKKASDAINHYLNHFRDRHSEPKALLVSTKGRKLNRQAIWHRITNLAKRAAIEKKLSPHTLRHTYASHLLQGGADIRVIQELLGHASIATTDRYTQLENEALREAFYKHHPRN